MVVDGFDHPPRVRSGHQHAGGHRPRHHAIPDVVIVTSKDSCTGSSFNQSDSAFVRLLDGRRASKWGAGVDAYKAALRQASTPRDPRHAGRRRSRRRWQPSRSRSEKFRRRPGVQGGRVNPLRWRTASERHRYNGAFNSVTVADRRHGPPATTASPRSSSAVWCSTTPATCLGGSASCRRERRELRTREHHRGCRRQRRSRDNCRHRQARLQPLRIDAVGLRGDDLLRRSSALTDGYPAIADYERTAPPSSSSSARQSARAERQDGASWTRALVPGSRGGGPPTIADFDNDGDHQMDDRFANGKPYNVFDYDPTNRSARRFLGEVAKDTQDGSSNVTGSSVFDFEGDG